MLSESVLGHVVDGDAGKRGSEDEEPGTFLSF